MSMSTYWMRWLDFKRLSALFAIVCSSPGTFTPGELDRIAIEKGVFVLANGKPSGKSNRYHHRRALERFALVQKVKGRYIPNLTREDSDTFLSMDGDRDLDESQLRLFSDRVVRNTDCFDVFWSAFVSTGRPGSIGDFIRSGQPIRLHLQEPAEGLSGAKRRYASSVLLYRASHPESPITHTGYNAVQAIHFGMRSWGIEQLGFLDELYQVGQGHNIFPIEINRSSDPETIDQVAYAALRFHGDWAMPRVSDLLLAVASQLKIPISSVRDRLQSWLEVHSADVAPVRVSDRMILSGSSERIRQLTLNGFLTPPSGGLVSHLKVHRGIADKFERRCLRESAHGSR